MKRITLRISQTLLVCGALAVGFTGCKKGEEAPAEASAGEPQAADKPPEPPKPPPVTDIKLTKKWPAGQAVTFVKSVKFTRAIATGTNSQERSTTYAISFGGGAGMDGGTMDGAASGGGGGATTLAQTLDMRIVGQKFEIGLNGKPMVSFTGKSAGGSGEEMMEDPDAGGAGGGPPPSPIAKAVEKSLGSSVKLTHDATGNITKVDGIQGQGGIYSKVFVGVPRGVQPMIGGMFSEVVFKEALLFHSLLNGTEAKKDSSWMHQEKGMMLLNWQQDFSFTNTFIGMEDWNGRRVAAFNITGGISGKTDRPVKSEIKPGGSFTGKALYAPDLGILVQRTINGKFDATETGQPAAYTFTQEFKVTQIGDAGGEDDM